LLYIPTVLYPFLSIVEVTMEHRLIDIIELAEYLGISKHTLYTWVSQRKIPYHKVGRLTKFDKAEIDEWIDNQAWVYLQLINTRLKEGDIYGCV